MSGYLLDSHTLIWWWTNDNRLGALAREAIASGSDAAVSAASLWEIAIKSAAGRLPQLPNFRAEYPALLETNGFLTLAIEEHVAVSAAYLPGEHRDPFDRLIAAQALERHMIVLTRDREIATFGCEVLW